VGELVSPILFKMVLRGILNKMKYICIKGCVINKKAVSSGTILDIASEEARKLLDIGRIAKYEEVQTENRSIGLEISTESVAKRRGRPRKK
jgi:hypothetical protein